MKFKVYSGILAASFLCQSAIANKDALQNAVEHGDRRQIVAHVRGTSLEDLVSVFEATKAQGRSDGVMMLRNAVIARLFEQVLTTHMPQPSPAELAARAPDSEMENPFENLWRAIEGGHRERIRTQITALTTHLQRVLTQHPETRQALRPFAQIVRHLDTAANTDLVCFLNTQLTEESAPERARNKKREFDSDVPVAAGQKCVDCPDDVLAAASVGDIAAVAKIAVFLPTASPEQLQRLLALARVGSNLRIRRMILAELGSRESATRDAVMQATDPVASIPQGALPERIRNPLMDLADAALVAPIPQRALPERIRTPLMYLADAAELAPAVPEQPRAMATTLTLVERVENLVPLLARNTWDEQDMQALSDFVLLACKSQREDLIFWAINNANLVPLFSWFQNSRRFHVDLALEMLKYCAPERLAFIYDNFVRFDFEFAAMIRYRYFPPAPQMVPIVANTNLGWPTIAAGYPMFLPLQPRAPQPPLFQFLPVYFPPTWPM